MYVNIFEYLKYFVLLHYNGPTFVSQTLIRILFCLKVTAVTAGMAVRNCDDFNACKKYA